METVSLYATCPSCEGHGRIAVCPESPRTEVCGKCHEKGRIATGDGQALLELLRLSGMAELTPDE